MVDFELVFKVMTKCAEFFVVDLLQWFFCFLCYFVSVLALRDCSFSFQFFFLATSVFFHKIVFHDYVFDYDLMAYLMFGGWQHR